jgi:hypothetical protein
LSQPAPSQFDVKYDVVQDLAGLLHPLHAEAFLAKDYSRTFVHVPGLPGKFAALLPWSVVNDILDQNRLEPPRLRLTREGTPVSPERYLRHNANSRKNGPPIPRLDSAALTRELREGATLVLDNVDELHRPIRRLAESLERVFRVRVQVNSYAGWRRSNGFDLHWDDHDVFILQVAGRKHWKVYGMTRPFPLARDVKPADAPRDSRWEGLLEDGDLLYIPRGWWHVATPLNEPTLHLTVGISNPTGADFLTWFANRLREAEVVRQDIPHLKGSDATLGYAERLMQAMQAAWRPELVDEYMADLDCRSTPRPSFTLPWSATQDILPSGVWRVQWAGCRSAPIETSADDLAVALRGRRWRFAPQAGPLLELLLCGRECTADDLFRAAGELAPDVILEFVRELAENGLVVVRAEE